MTKGEDRTEKSQANRLTLMTTRLSMNDEARFMEMCKLEGKTHTELARRAIIEMMDRQEAGTTAEVKDKLAERLKKMEDRMAALMARNNLDIGIVYQLLWLRSDPEKRDALFAAARKHAARRSSKALADEDLEIQRADQVSHSGIGRGQQYAVSRNTSILADLLPYNVSSA